MFSGLAVGAATVFLHKIKASMRMLNEQIQIDSADLEGPMPADGHVDHWFEKSITRVELSNRASSL